MRYICPTEIINLFATEQLAANLGRSAVIDWMKTLPLISGDTVLIPISADEMCEIYKNESRVQ